MKKFFKSFGYAFLGIITALKKERNLKIHFIAMIIVIIFGIVLRITKMEWIICIILFASVISLEMVNTAIENVVDLVTEEQNPKAKIAKDTAAGAVLISAVSAAIIGLVIFIPKFILILMKRHFLVNELKTFNY